jgi:hypothetical protein
MVETWRVFGSFSDSLTQKQFRQQSKNDQQSQP